MERTAFWTRILGFAAILAVMAFSACDSGGGGGGGETVSVTGVTLNKDTLSLTVGGTETLTATVAPTDAKNKAVTWSTSNSSVATESDGTVTALSTGSAAITVTTTDGSKTASCAVTVLPLLYDPDATDKTTNIGKTGPGGGIIFYYSASGFIVTGYGNPGDSGYFAEYTANYLEAAPSNQATSIPWCNCATFCSVTTDTAFGIGKANTAAIINVDHHSGDTTSNNAAKAANITISGKDDWFLPSKDELNEMYNARSHLDISSGSFWSSSQYSSLNAWTQSFSDGSIGANFKYSHTRHVRAIRAF